mgnify:CR=1 FL=1
MDWLLFYVNFGCDSLPQAKEVLVFMLVALNDHWKMPVGYFFLDGLNSSEKSNLVQQCLHFLSEVDITITSLTFDSAPTNITMANILGANLDDPKKLSTRFTHNVTGGNSMGIF